MVCSRIVEDSEVISSVGCAACGSKNFQVLRKGAFGNSLPLLNRAKSLEASELLDTSRRIARQALNAVNGDFNAACRNLLFNLLAPNNPPFFDLAKSTEKELAADASKKGKAAFSKWRMAHADNHLNVQPGEYGEPMLHHDMCDQLLDALHLAELNLPKIIFKYSLPQNASDDARATISDMLAGWKHPLDTRRKEDGRQRQQKWFTGAKFHSF